MARFIIIAFVALLFFCSCSHSYFIVRHAEKEAVTTNMMGSDVPLTVQGKQRAEALKNRLAGKKIAYVYSTNTIRTKSTAQPAADYFKLTIEPYGPLPDSAFIRLLKSKKKNTLVVGHSNTVDDIVNALCGEVKIPADLKDSEYDNLFIVTYRGKKIIFTNEKITLPGQR